MAVLAQLPEVRTPMSHTMEIRPGMSPREIYEQTDWPEHMHVELLDGRLVMTGSASIQHARIIVRLLRMFLGITDRKGWEVFTEVSVHIVKTHNRPRPDLLIAPRDAPQYDKHEFFAHGVLLAAEVTSPGSKHEDRHGKPGYYATGEVPLYLLVDLDATPQQVTLFSDPRDGKYQRQMTVNLGGVLDLPAPFSLRLDTAELAPE